MARTFLTPVSRLNISSVHCLFDYPYKTLFGFISRHEYMEMTTTTFIMHNLKTKINDIFLYFSC